MKKLLTILLALLVVTGVVFAAEDSTLTLSATKDVVLQQGITVEKVTSGVALSDGYTNTGEKFVLLDESWDSSEDANTWGDDIYYTILTNSKDTVSVTVDITPLTLDTEGSSKYYVPYVLTIGDSTFEFASGSAPGITSIAKVSGTSLDLTVDDNWGNKTSMRYYNGLIGVAIVGNPEDAMEGEYLATITFNVTNGT